MDRKCFEIELKHHAFIRAMQRGITPDLVENCIKNGSIERFGKNYIKFISKSTICIGEIAGLKIKMITIERREK